LTPRPSWLRTSAIDSLRRCFSIRRYGAVYNTLQQLVESQSRHGSEVAQHRAQDDDQDESD
jgi:hypothetical protein